MQVAIGGREVDGARLGVRRGAVAEHAQRDRVPGVVALDVAHADRVRGRGQRKG